MDVMELRRRLMMGMAVGGLNYVKGIYTVPDTGDAIVNFGKSFQRYIFLIEMTDESKSNLVQSGATGNKMFSICGTYPMPNIDGESGTPFFAFSRINPSTSGVSSSYSTSALYNFTDSSITLAKGDFSSGAQYFYIGSSYNYYIFEL